MTFTLHPVMRQGTAASLPGAWERHPTPEAAKAAAKEMYRDDRVLRVMVVEDDLPPRFVAWVER